MADKQKSVDSTNKEAFVTSQGTDDKEAAGESALHLLNRVYSYVKGTKGFNTNDQILIRERMLFLALEESDPAVLKQIDYNIAKELRELLREFNGLAMEAYQKKNRDESIRQISRALDLISLKNVEKYSEPTAPLDEMRVVTYNNLSLIYEDQRKLGLALKAVNTAIELEEKLVQANHEESCVSIVSTYFNKSAILSSLKKHEKSIESVEKGIEYLKKAEGVVAGLKDSQRAKDLYKFGFYSLGVEYEYLASKEKSLANYERAYQIATELNDGDMKYKIEKAKNSLVK